jgi:Putative rhamnosyl transferase
MASAHRIQIKGLIRFSYLSQNGFSQSAQGLEKTRALLYDPARLDRRFALFEQLALHSLALQDDPDFSVAVLIGDSLPDTARARLENLLVDFKQAHLVALPPLVHIQAVKQAFAVLPDDPKASHIASFRQDDDDAMHRATLGRIRTMGMTLLQSRETKRPFVIGFNRGFYFDPAAAEPISEWYERTPLGIGLAMVAQKGDHATIFRRNHRQLTEYYDCYTETTRPMFIRSVHQDNDSAAEATGRRGQLRPAGIRRNLRDGFDLTPEILENL